MPLRLRDFRPPTPQHDCRCANCTNRLENVSELEQQLRAVRQQMRAMRLNTPEHLKDTPVYQQAWYLLTTEQYDLVDELQLLSICVRA